VYTGHWARFALENLSRSMGYCESHSAKNPVKTKVPSRHIPSLDGIRAVSFLLVFVSHAGLGQYVPGGMGVTVFFFLSGFLITTLMRSEYQKSGTLNLRHFWARRALRILPCFYLVLLGAMLASSFTWAAISAQALHITNYWSIFHGGDGFPKGTGVYWSLSVEEHFYFLFPWVFIAMQRMRGRNQMCLLYGLCIVILAWRFLLVLDFHASNDRTYMATDTRVDSILYGCALAVWWNPDRLQLSEERWKRLYSPAAVALLIACLVVRNEIFRETLRYSLQGVALTVLFISAMRFPFWTPMRVLNSKVLSFLGVLSYSLYLLHFAVIIGVQRIYPLMVPLAQGVLALTTSLACAYILYVTVEKPCAKLRRRFN
jgi:peptidoglycan/LPS O-acetylase OafA/YrhL